MAASYRPAQRRGGFGCRERPDRRHSWTPSLPPQQGTGGPGKRRGVPVGRAYVPVGLVGTLAMVNQAPPEPLEPPEPLGPPAGSSEVKTRCPPEIFVILPSVAEKDATYCCRSSSTRATMVWPSFDHLGSKTGRSRVRLKITGAT